MLTEPGIYRGQCAELCGKDHAYMLVVLEAVSESDFADWVVRKKRELARLLRALTGSGRWQNSWNEVKGFILPLA